MEEKILKILAHQQVITNQGINYTGEKDWALNELLKLNKSEINLAVSKEREEKEMLADALLDMYGQYCDDGHMFMTAGEHASGVLERLGYAKFDDAGTIINTK